jgi:hypothetical protein
LEGWGCRAWKVHGRRHKVLIEVKNLGTFWLWVVELPELRTFWLWVVELSKPKAIGCFGYG